jgi:ribosome-binding factor A
MKNRRPEIVGDEMQKVISTIIATKLKDPRVPIMTSVTSVKMSRDLSHATVFISVYGDEKTQKEAMEAIEHAKGFIRYETVQEINLRVAPELSFKLDNTLNNALRMEALIDKTIKEDEASRLAREEKNGTKEEGGEEA